MRVECAPRACTSWSTAAAALIWPVCEFLAAGCWAAAQSCTGVTLIRRCAGLPMQHELLSTTARALALLQHPSRFTCPHTLLHRRCAFRAHRQDLQLPPVFRAQVGSEAMDPILVVDNAFSMLQIRPGDACFAVLEALSVAPLTRACAGEGRCRRFSCAREPKDGRLAQSMSWSSHMHADSMCNYIFRKRER